MGRKPLSEQQRLHRREKIIDAAAGLYGTTAFEHIRVSSIANQAGIAKGTVFLYFETKEEIFAALGRRGLTAWFSDFGARIETVMESEVHSDVEHFLLQLNASFDQFAWLPRLLLDLDCRIYAGEPGHDDYVNCRLELIDAGGELAEAYFPYLEEGTGRRIFARIISLLPAVAGFGGVWTRHREIEGTEVEDPLIHRSGGSAARDFYLHSIRRILKGYSLQ
jgi:AcrR family transcriptional regulator